MAEPDIQSLIEAWDSSDALQYAFRWLYKDGLETGFYAELLQRAPNVTRAFAAKGHLQGYAEFADAMQLTDVSARNERLHAVEKTPGATWKATLGQVRAEDRPLLEAWIDRCVNLETGRAPKSAIGVGSRVRHNTFGEGTITALVNQNATVTFDSAGEKRLRMTFLEVVS